MATKSIFLTPFLALLLVLWSSSDRAARGQAASTIPDLTKTIDFERTGEYHLGPTGLKGWIHAASNFMTTEARQILVTQVAEDSAADGILEVGDVILGVGTWKGDAKHFDSDARKAFGNAIDDAERNENKGILKLIRWRPVADAAARQGSVANVQLTLKVMGTYSETSPYDCPKTKQILEDALKFLVGRVNGGQIQMGRLSEIALALLATGEESHREMVREYLHDQKWASPEYEISLESGGLVCWSMGYRGVLLTEYYLATGDEYVLPAIREHAIKTAMGQSNGGTWGHGFAWTSKNDGKLHGKLSGYGAVNQAGLPCFLSLVLAKRCGVNHPEVDQAIGHASRFFQQFIGKGSIGYGYHRPSLEIYASGRNGMSGNGKNGIAAIAFRSQGVREGTEFFSKLTASLYNTCEYGHSGNSYSYFWDPIGSNCGGPKLASAFLKEMRWYYALTRQANGSFEYQELGGVYGRSLLDPTAAQVLIATMPGRAIYLTGKGQNKSEWLDDSQVQQAISAGRWRLANPDELEADELVAKLNSWSPIAREWVAKRLAQKFTGEQTLAGEEQQEKIVLQLIQQLSHENAAARAGACAALGHLGEHAATAIPDLAKVLNDKDSAVCMAAGYALARVGEKSQQAVPELLRAILASDEPEKMKPKQQALAYAFGYASGRYAPLYFDGILAQAAKDKNPLSEIDRELLHPAIAKLLNDPSGRTRGSGAYAMRFFTPEDTALMAQQIYDVIKTPADNYTMFDDDARQRGLELLVRLRLKEGIQLCFETFDHGRWGSHARNPSRFKILQDYGGNVKPYMSQLVAMRSNWKSGESREMLEETIKIIEADDSPQPLISIHDLVDQRLAKDLESAKNDSERTKLCRNLMGQVPHDYFFQAAGLRELVSISDENGISDILAALSSSNAILRTTAIQLGSRIRGTEISNKWVSHLATAKSQRLAGILDILGQRHEIATLPAIETYLRHEDELVRAAAIRAKAAFDGPAPAS